MTKTILALMLTALSTAAYAAGTKCTSDKDCGDKMSCVGKANAKTCAKTCSTSKDCGEDQRCVPDNGAKVCHPIVDGPDL